jgi:hypothetical protein
MIKLVNTKETYDVTFKAGTDEEVIFSLRKLTADEVNRINDETIVSRGENSMAYLNGTASRMKISKALTAWKGVADGEGKDVPCNDANKALLPSEVQQFLIDKIDLDNGLRKTREGEKTEKN